jgi:hypothetical protein
MSFVLGSSCTFKVRSEGVMNSSHRHVQRAVCVRDAQVLETGRSVSVSALASERAFFGAREVEVSQKLRQLQVVTKDRQTTSTSVHKTARTCGQG